VAGEPHVLRDRAGDAAKERAAAGIPCSSRSPASSGGLTQRLRTAVMIH
jgi:hypothetical protein